MAAGQNQKQPLPPGIWQLCTVKAAANSMPQALEVLFVVIDPHQGVLWLRLFQSCDTQHSGQQQTTQFHKMIPLSDVVALSVCLSPFCDVGMLTKPPSDASLMCPCWKPRVADYFLLLHQEDKPTNSNIHETVNNP